MQNRIKELRDTKGWSMRDLAARANTSASTINKLEKGETKLTVVWMERLSKIFGVPPEQMLKRSSMTPVSDDVELFTPNGGDFSALRLTESQVLYRVKANVLDQIGIVSGDILVAETTPEEIAAVRTGDIVIARIREDETVQIALRQFIEPSMLITNSSSRDQAIANLRTQDIGLKAIVISSHSTLRRKSVAR